MKKVLHIGKFYPPYYGGIEQVTQDLVQSLSRDYINIVLVFNSSNSSVKQKIDGVLIYREAMLFSLFSQPFSLKYIKRFLQLVTEVDILHIHLPNMFALLCLNLIRLERKIIFVHWHSDIVKQKLLSFFIRPFEDRVLKQATRILVTSMKYAQESFLISNFMEKVDVLPCSVNEGKLNYNLEKEKRTKKRIFFIGRHIPYKGLDLLVKAANKWGDHIETIIAGQGPLTKKLKRMSENSSTIFVGRINDEEKSYYMSNSDLFVLPSTTKNEAFGVVIAEALSFSLPVVCFDVKGSGVSWVNKHDVTGIVVEQIQWKQLHDEIVAVLNKPDQLVKFSKNCYQRYIDNFSLSAFSERAINIYRRYSK
jgi:glycosyltransferase involved in cell wall biosynthesis